MLANGKNPVTARGSVDCTSAIFMSLIFGGVDIKAEGYSILNSTLANIATTPVQIVNQDGSITKQNSFDLVSQGVSKTVSGITQSINPLGINLFNNNNSSVDTKTSATPKKLGN
jgi:hypothetical protein